MLEVRRIDLLQSPATPMVALLGRSRVVRRFSAAWPPDLLTTEPALQFAEKLFFRSFRTKKPSQVIESSFVEMTEITRLVPFSANCLAGDTASAEADEQCIAEKVRFERFVTGHDFSRADKLFIYCPTGAPLGAAQRLPPLRGSGLLLPLTQHSAFGLG
jgi:hypothetical protein